MVQVQVDLSEEENKLLNMYRLIYDLENKPDAIKHLISSQKKRIEGVKEKNRMEIEKAEQEAETHATDSTPEEEEEAEAYEELMGI